MKKIISSKQKALIAIEAIKGMKTTNQIGSDHEVHPIRVGVWKKQLLERAHTVFSGEKKDKEKEKEALIERLYKIIGQRDVELEWLKKKVHIES